MARIYKNPEYAHMSDEQKAAYLHDARRRGGITRCAQESMQEARSKGFWATVESHPFFARKYLRRRMKAQGRVKLIQSVLPPRPARPRRPLIDVFVKRG